NKYIFFLFCNKKNNLREGRKEERIQRLSHDVIPGLHRKATSQDFIPRLWRSSSHAGGVPGVLGLVQLSSPKPASTRATRASMASGPSGPSASSTITVPGPAASIIRPIMDVPSTVWPSRMTRTCASKVSAHLTNLAEARACIPLRLQMVTDARGLSWLNIDGFAWAYHGSPDKTWLAMDMYLRPASLAAVTASLSLASPRRLANLISIGRVMPATHPAPAFL